MKRSSSLILFGLITVVSVTLCILLIIKTTVNEQVLPLPGDGQDEEVVIPDQSAEVIQPWNGESPKDASSQSVPEKKATAPTKIEIPSLSINARIVQVGITKTGAMATPGAYADVGWYKYGTLPGQTGSAVLAGHVDNGLALAGVFKHLSDVQNGDDIYVTLSTGERIHFVVESSTVYNYKEVPTHFIFHRDDGAYIALVTCTGTLIRSEHTYDQRLVVFAKKV